MHICHTIGDIAFLLAFITDNPSIFESSGTWLQLHALYMHRGFLHWTSSSMHLSISHTWYPSGRLMRLRSITRWGRWKRCHLRSFFWPIKVKLRSRNIKACSVCHCAMPNRPVGSGHMVRYVDTCIKKTGHTASYRTASRLVWIEGKEQEIG